MLEFSSRVVAAQFIAPPTLMLAGPSQPPAELMFPLELDVNVVDSRRIPFHRFEQQEKTVRYNWAVRSLEKTRIGLSTRCKAREGRECDTLIVVSVIHSSFLLMSFGLTGDVEQLEHKLSIA